MVLMLIGPNYWKMHQLTRSNQCRCNKALVLLLVAPSFMYNTARSLMLAQSVDHPLQLDTPLPPKPKNRTVPANESAECTNQSPEWIRSSGIHWTVDAARANVSMYALLTNTLGVHISSSGGISPEEMKMHLGRNGLIAEQEKIMMSNSLANAHIIPKMTTKRDNRSAPDYDNYLGCAPGCTPDGVALVVVQNFYCANIWHALANIQGIWMLLKIVHANTDNTVVLPREYGSPFASPPRYFADAIYPLFVRQLNGVNKIRRDMEGTVPNCFKQILFIETGGYRPGPLWGYQALHDTVFASCGRDSPYTRMQTDFRNEVQTAANQVLDSLGLHFNASLPNGIVIRPVHVCYMSRRLRGGRRRYFSRSLEPIIEGSIDSWARRQNSDKVSFHRLEFDESVPFEMQVHWMRWCTVLFGPHGAGLGHEIWMKEGGYIVEFGDASKCQPYYGAMASWYGHHYICFSKLKGHGISMSKDTYDALNETLLLDVLDSVVSKQLARFAPSDVFIY
mmetsp:Transcript_3929/g.8303  ORF Transcript_3929/g.8303 Transcript_3929/m.8303 type:complete len:506 (+) Transcript_3929:165-1682(+)|eukprot:CAMPEP_0172525840 /NCGR_PEP_ID=MMETSP1067-20121228/853_1 /TAXON_ID=265564 ORGANISM="Thalassiosira punctigera, Strain Tpunct2005C2" /NCGR_SAMPLE_ID=MMETSP1067 /ASSEMBLY_ACC=CAM_ASM_000444 /LENGTH=505 /DNA_ID=CAMNT_0013309215 /DNA_START=681 /DNA_END=2198 /DNA_ORIENTATION=-